MRIAFFNPQGNFDSQDSYWGAHPDFGGQLVYVKEVAIALAKLGVNVDIITRRIEDPHWPEFSKRFDYYPGVENVRIVRIDFGGKKFLPKEELWPHLRKYAENVLNFYKTEGKTLDFVTTHYGDGGIAGAMFSKWTGIPYSFTAHSLGAQKLYKLLNEKVKNFPELDSVYKFSARIAAERVAMKYSSVNIVSTCMEKREQYGHPLYKEWIDVNDDKKFIVIPPGVNFKCFNSYHSAKDNIVEQKVLQSMGHHIRSKRNSLPWIVLSSRMDPKKNHIALIKAYATDRHLQSIANILIVTRGIDDVYQDYEDVPESEKNTLKKIIESIYRNRLEDKVFFVNIKGQKELASLYRIAAKRHSVFSLPTLYEPFGLAVIEAMACGLPVVATKNGGPSEILREDNIEYGVLVDPEDSRSIADGLSEILGNIEAYLRFQKLGLTHIASKYTWENTAQRYLETIYKIKKKVVRKVNIPKFFINGRNPQILELNKYYNLGNN